MANLVKLYGDRVELPFQAYQYPLTPATFKLQEGLEGYQALKLDGALHAMPLAERQQVTRFLYQYGHLLFRTLFPGDAFARLAPGAPLLLELQPDWSAYPWELLNDGNQWLALARGVARFAYPPVPGPAAHLPAAAAAPLRVVGASAVPLPLSPGSRVGRDAAALGTRFIASFPHLGEAAEAEGLPVAYRHLEHATLPALEQALARQPHVLIFSGFASEEGWYLESERLTGQCAPWEWLLQRVREAVPRGLRLLVLADSPGLAAPLTAVHRTRELLRAGVPAVIRIEGHVGRDRQQAYLEALLGALAAGSPVEAAHQAALRGLFRSHEEAWEWCFLRLYPQALAGGEAAPAPYAVPGAAGTRPVLEAPGDATARFATPPAPPALRDRRRCFNRTAQQKRLFEALFPEKETASSLVFLSGPPGSGKTHLALEMARRLQRRFEQVLYLPQRALLPEPDAPPVPGAHVPAGAAGVDPAGGAEASPEAPTMPEREGAATEPAPTLADGRGAAPLLSALATHLGAATAPGATAAELREALHRHCADGTSRLVILDRWERGGDYDAFCEALQGLPRACRVLLLSRGAPPLLPGASVTLEPLEAGELEHVFGAGLRERLRALEAELDPEPEHDGTLEQLCRTDLFLARVLRRAPRLPGREGLAGVLAALRAEGARDVDEDGGSGAAGARLLALLVEGALPTLEPDASAALPVLAFFPWLVHRDVLAEGADLEGPRLTGALEALQWLGWVDACDGGRYVALHPRLHGLLGERLVTLGALERLQGRLLRAYRRYLAGTAAALREAPPRRLRYAPPLLGWAEARCEGLPADWVRRLHRLGVERVNLAELALLLADTGEWRPLERLANDAAPLWALREAAPLGTLLHRTLLTAGEQQGDPVLQADALNRLAAPLVEARRTAQATPLLERALTLLQHTAGWPVLGETYRLLSRCYELAGRLDAAESLLQSAAELAQQLGSGALLTHASQALARLWAQRGGAPADGDRFLARQATYLHQNDRPLEAALVLRAQAELLFRRGEREAARERYEEVLAVCREAGHAGETARTLLRVADCRLADGDAEGAYALVHEAAAGPGGGALDLEEQGRLLSEICRVFEQHSQLQEALDGYLRIREVLEQIGDRQALIGVLDRIGGLYFQLGEQAKSTRCYEERLHLQAALATR